MPPLRAIREEDFMKKRLVLFPVLTLLVACNGHQEEGKVLARIDGEPFTTSDFDARLLAENHFNESGMAPDMRRDDFDRMLRSRLGALAARKDGFFKNDSLRRRLDLSDQRVIVQYYYDDYLKAHGGHTEKELKAFYLAHPQSFSDDSGKLIPFLPAESRIADSLDLSTANLDSFYLANSANYRQRASCEVSLIKTAKRKTAEAALKALQGGMSFAAAAMRYSTDPSKKNGGKIGSVQEGEPNYTIGQNAPLDSLFFDSTTRLKPGQVSRPIPKDSEFVLVRPDSCHDAVLPPLAAEHRQVMIDYLREYKNDLVANVKDRLDKKYQLKRIPVYKEPTEAEIQNYYNQNKTNYESPETYEIYDIETAKKAKVSPEFQKVKDLAAFKALAAKTNENSWTKSQDGYVGVIKRDYCLPYGIGMLPDLFSAMDTLNAGKVGPIYSTTTQNWNFFWLVKKGPRTVKPLERVHTLVKQDLIANRVTSVAPTDTLAITGNGHVFLQSDVDFLREEIPAYMRERFTREQVLDYLIYWQLPTDEAKSLGLTDEPKLIGARAQNSDAFWNNVYNEFVLKRTEDEDTTLLANTFAKNRSVFTKDSGDTDWHTHVADIAGYLELTPKDFEIEYHTNPEKYRHDTTAMTFDEARFDIYRNLADLGQERLQKSEFEKLKRRFHARIEDASLREPSYEPPGKYLKEAQKLHYNRELEKALTLYQQLREHFPNNEGVQDSVSFGMAQIYVEQENFQQALAEYRRVSYLYPHDADDYKAMFMVGFILSENLKQDSAAVRAFQSMLDKYPKTDLSDDADWMIRNIRSGGKLMPVLHSDSGWSAPDSTGSKGKAGKK